MRIHLALRGQGLAALCCIVPWDLVGLQAAAQQTRYSATPEYRQMLEEIRSPFPSPAYIATGVRPQADAKLEVTVKPGQSGLQAQTSSARFVVDPDTGSILVQNLKTESVWTYTVSSDGCSSPAKPAPSVLKPVQPAGANRWTAQFNSGCGPVQIDLQMLTARLARLTLSLPSESASAGPGGPARLHLHVQGGGPYFGLGERFWQAGLSGTTLDVRPQDRSGEPGHNWTYVAIPLVYNAGGLGFYADTAFDTKFRFNQPDTSFDMEMFAASVPLYLMAESSPKAVLSAYTGITGRPQDPPQWTFGPWITALGGYGPVLEAADRIRREDMPASALWIYDQNDEKDNLGWPFWFSSYYGDPHKFVDLLHGMGFRVLTYVHPYVRAEMMPFFLPSPQFDKGVSQGFLATGADGKPAGPRFEMVQTGNVDFTNPAAVDWWQGMITGAVQTQGFDGWMEDFGEWVRDTDRFAAGTGKTLSELYPLLYHKVTLRVAQSLNPSVVPFSRSGSPGSQAFSPVLWGADQSANWSRDYGLPSVVTAGITAGMSGYSTWGPDILSTGSNRDLWMRWVEFGALTPVMRDHVWDRPSGSFNIFSDAATTAHFRRWAAFHSSLLPYLVTYAQEASQTGIPIMRHTMLEFPDDPRSASAEYQYLLGHELLVAPVVQGGQTLRQLYLPPGEWVNFWNGDFLTGGQDVTVDASEIPILVRAGSVLPFKPEEGTGTWNWDDPGLLTSSLVWRVYPSITGASDSSFKLPNGTAAHFSQQGSTVTVEGISQTRRDYEVIFRTKEAPTAVLLGGKVFAAVTPGPDGHAASEWWWNPSSSEVHLRFHADNFRIEVRGIVPAAYEN